MLDNDTSSRKEKLRIQITQKLTPVKNIKLKLNLQDKLTTLFSLTPLFSFPGNFQKHENVSPKIGLYGFLAISLFLPAWNADKYHRTNCTILSLGVSISGILKYQYQPLFSAKFLCFTNTKG